MLTWGNRTRLAVSAWALAMLVVTVRADEKTGFDPRAYVPSDAAIVAHIDVATLNDAPAFAAVKDSKSKSITMMMESASKALGIPALDLKTFTYIVPKVDSPFDMTKSISITTTRKAIDRPKLVAALKETAKTQRLEFSENGDRVTLKSGNQYTPSIYYDLSHADAVVASAGDENLIKPQATEKGAHSEALKAHAKAPLLLSIHFDTLMPDMIRGAAVPPKLKAFQPLVDAQHAIIVGMLGTKTLDFNTAFQFRTKQNAIDGEKALDDARSFADEMLIQIAKPLEKAKDENKTLLKLVDATAAMLKDAKIKLNDKLVTGTMTMSLDLPFVELVEAMAGSSDRITVQNNFKQVGLAFHNYDSAYNHLPTAATLDKKAKKLHSWRVEILPYIEQEALYKQFKLDEPWDSEHNLKVVKDNPMPAVYAIPGTKNLDDKKTHYQVFVGTGAAFEPTGPIRIPDYTDGTSNTVWTALAETAVDWTKPDDIEFDASAEMGKKLLWLKGDVTVVGFADGSVRTIKKTIREATLKAAITRNGGEVLNLDDE